MTRLNDIRLKAGWNQTLTDSDNIEGFTPSSGETVRIPGIGAVHFYAQQTLPEFIEGQRRYSPSSGESFAGLKQCRYFQEICHIDSYSWLKTNYRGNVTVYLKTDSTTYARWNARLRFEYERYEAPDWIQLTWIYALVEAL